MLGAMYEVRTLFSRKLLPHQAAETLTAELSAVTIDASPFHVTINTFRDKNSRIDLTSL
jgi:hypothetical protein